ncbi:hypothetical protein FVE85_2636 [Porphyridium purpureum]|uniref:Glutathione S-transferase n=1 Tax=Porphyridium purpureum TaxID=35688 RepID=A0A5J4YT75_PORPP|nr:hypothetical protein FVE85_2636 [Porphyridium purpureum]|eukprot:POR4199..scf227_4
MFVSCASGARSLQLMRQGHGQRQNRAVCSMSSGAGVDFVFYRGVSSRTRSAPVSWFLHESGLRPGEHFKEVRLNLQAQETRDPAKNPHPFGKVPCVELAGEQTPGEVIFESAAILSYLQRRYAAKDLTDAQLAAISSWVVWANASLGPGLVIDRSKQSTLDSLKVLDTLLETAAFLVADRLTAADCAVVHLTVALRKFIPELDPVLEKLPHLSAYLERLQATEGYQKYLVAEP